MKKCNGRQEVVTVMYEVGSGNNSDVYGVERRSWPFSWLRKYTRERWHISIPVSYPLLPPTLANIDSENLISDAL